MITDSNQACFTKKVGWGLQKGSGKLKIHIALQVEGNDHPGVSWSDRMSKQYQNSKDMTQLVREN